MTDIHDMVNLKNIELPLSELGKIGELGGVARFRQTQPVLIATHLPEFNACVINLFAPRGNIFWNFDCYQKLYFSEHSFYQEFIVPERVSETDAALTALIKQAGHKRRSNFSRQMMGGWTQRDGFDPVDERSDWRYCAHRQFSILVPEQDVERVLVHFRSQIEVFGNESFAPCSEEATPVEFGDLRSTQVWKLLYENVARMNAEERTWLCAEVARFTTNQDVSIFVANLDLRFFIKGLISLAGVKSSFVSLVDMKCFAEVLRFRSRVALAACRLPALVSKEYDLRNAIVGVYPEGLLEELLEALQSRLDPYRPMFDFQLSTGTAGAGEK